MAENKDGSTKKPSKGILKSSSSFDTKESNAR